MMHLNIQTEAGAISLRQAVSVRANPLYFDRLRSTLDLAPTTMHPWDEGMLSMPGSQVMLRPPIHASLREMSAAKLRGGSRLSVPASATTYGHGSAATTRARGHGSAATTLAREHARGAAVGILPLPPRPETSSSPVRGLGTPSSPRPDTVPAFSTRGSRAMDDKLELHMDVQLRPEPPSREAQPSLPPFFQRPSSGAPAAAARPRSPFDVLAESDPRLSAASNVALPASPAAALASTLASPRHDTRRSTSRGGTRDERRAAALFLGRHDTLYALAHFEAGRASRQPADGRCGEAVERLTQELQWNRYRPPERALQLVSRKARVAKAKVEKAWCLEESCWKARAAWSDSGTFYDTEEVFEKAFSLDWSRALRSHGLAAYILRNDDGDSDSDEEEAEAAVEQVEPLAEREEVSGEGAIMSERERRRIERSLAHGEVVEVGNVLWTHHKSIYRTFDAYAGIGASVSSGCDHMSGNAFKLLVTDCKLYDGKHCKKTHVDQLFLLVNGREASKSSRGQAEQVDVSAIAGALGNAADVGSADDDTRSLSRC